jgi:hypothetical protein
MLTLISSSTIKFNEGGRSPFRNPQLPLRSLSGDEILNDSEDPLLLVPWKPADFFEDAAGFTSGTGLLLTPVFPPEQMGKGGRSPFISKNTVQVNYFSRALLMGIDSACGDALPKALGAPLAVAV